jgi:glycosyltransferase involved in cell wall biosynthesis
MTKDQKSDIQPSADTVSPCELKYSVIIPVFNEEPNLALLFSRLNPVMQSLGGSYEIIYIDDGSHDGSYKILKETHEKDPHIKVIRFTRNFGQHPAVSAGFEAARGEIIITIDSDLQNPPEEIPKLLSKLDEGYEVVFGIFKERKHSAYRRIGSWFTKKILALILKQNVTSLSAFRVMRHYVVKKLQLFGEKSKFIDALICWMGYRVGVQEVGHEKRHAGKTKYNLLKLIGMWFDIVVSLTDFPLKLATYSGAVLSGVSFIIALYYLIMYFATGYNVPGFATTVILISIFAGIQLFCLGILGEYIGRMNKEIKKKPEYIVREILDKEK